MPAWCAIEASVGSMDASSIIAVHVDTLYVTIVLPIPLQYQELTSRRAHEYVVAATVSSLLHC